MRTTFCGLPQIKDLDEGFGNDAEEPFGVGTKHCGIKPTSHITLRLRRGGWSQVTE